MEKKKKKEVGWDRDRLIGPARSTGQNRFAFGGESVNTVLAEARAGWTRHMMDRQGRDRQVGVMDRQGRDGQVASSPDDRTQRSVITQGGKSSALPINKSSQRVSL